MKDKEFCDICEKSVKKTVKMGEVNICNSCLKDYDKAQKGEGTSFEKQFPSLKGKHFEHDADIGPVFNCYSDSCIRENCIDKQRVRDALEVIKSIANMIPNDLLCDAGRNVKMYLKQTIHKTIDFKKKELGLEK